MRRRIRVVGVVGLVLTLAGGTGIIWGLYNQETYSCESGSSTVVYGLSENGDTPSTVSDHARAAIEPLAVKASLAPLTPFHADQPLHISHRSR